MKGGGNEKGEEGGEEKDGRKSNRKGEIGMKLLKKSMMLSLFDILWADKFVCLIVIRQVFCQLGISL